MLGNFLYNFLFIKLHNKYGLKNNAVKIYTLTLLTL